MAKFSGEIGYGVAIESPPGSGVWVDEITEVSAFGDVIRNTRQLEPGGNLHSNITLNNSISIIADQYAIQNFAYIKYIRWNDVLWAVTTVEVQSPRLILSLGGVYNGPTV